MREVERDDSKRERILERRRRQESRGDGERENLRGLARFQNYVNL